MNAFRYLKYETLEKVECMTLSEYLYKMKAHELSRVDEERDMHMRSWLDREINTTKKQGDKEVYVYKSFKDFFDYEKAIDNVSMPDVKQVSDKHKRMAQIAAKLNGNP